MPAPAAPHRNVELKGVDPDPAATLAAALALGATDEGVLAQRDTYFGALHGRLKLREAEPGGAELIAYARADDAQARESAYHLVATPEPAALAAALDAALGTTVVVEKRRHLLLLGAVRIHLDDVARLGRFVELEAVAPPGSDLAPEHAEIARIRAAIGLSDDRVVAEGYAGLLLAAGGATARLVDLAREVRGRAHAPYSRFHVGAALRDERGVLHAGANVENASYPEGHCAETSAIGRLVASGGTRIHEIAVLADADLITPCGGCRQRLAEFADAGTPVHLCGPEGIRRTLTLGELLPLGFAGTDLPGMTGLEQMEAVRHVRRRTALVPRIGIVLGSGLGVIADAVEDAVSFAFTELPGFPQGSVAGHARTLHLGTLAGVPVAVLEGRTHLYEGVDVAALTVPIRTLRGLGAEAVLLTNAAGSLVADVGPGQLMALTDHINLMGTNPLLGPNDEAIGPRFVAMGAAYDAGLREQLRAAARAEGIGLAAGVYLAVTGPAFETPAEIRAFKVLGADAVGMSTVPEVLVAVHCGLRVAAVSCITNLAEGMSDEVLSHEGTLAAAAVGAQDLARLIPRFLQELS